MSDDKPFTKVPLDPMTLILRAIADAEEDLAEPVIVCIRLSPEDLRALERSVEVTLKTIGSGAAYGVTVFAGVRLCDDYKLPPDVGVLERNDGSVALFRLSTGKRFSEWMRAGITPRTSPFKI